MTRYLTDPDQISRQSFALIRQEADLSGIPDDDQALAERMIHACGQADLAADLVLTPGARGAGSQALAEGVPIFCDSAMVAAGLSAAIQNRKVVRIGAPETACRARTMKTTRSAAQVDGWLPDLAGALVLIGNAPTALFRLLELLEGQAHLDPALLIACPVGFVGAAESKAALIAAKPAFPFVTVKGRRGGTPMTAAALNACALPPETA